jgi:hypothetical protein
MDDRRPRLAAAPARVVRKRRLSVYYQAYHGYVSVLHETTLRGPALSIQGSVTETAGCLRTVVVWEGEAPAEPSAWVPHPSPLAKGGGRKKSLGDHALYPFLTLAARVWGIRANSVMVGSAHPTRHQRSQSTLRAARREARPPEGPAETVTHAAGRAGAARNFFTG